MLVEQDVARHYTHGTLERAILDALLASGKNIERLAPSDLSSVDEFHLGWRAATAALAENRSLERGMHVLSKLLESGQREQGVLLCRGQILQVDHGRQVLGQGE
jgi:hypothetical protein